MNKYLSKLLNRALAAKKKYLSKSQMTSLFKQSGLFSLSVAVFVLLAAGGLTSCKAWRTVSTSATYVQQTDSTGRNTATISTKTVEEYQGVKKK